MQGKIKYSNETGETSFLQYKYDRENMDFHFLLNFSYFNFQFCLKKYHADEYIDELFEWLDSKPSERVFNFINITNNEQLIHVCPMRSTVIQSLGKIRISHPKKGLVFGPNDIFKVQIIDHKDVFLNLSDIKNILEIIQSV